MRIEEVKHLDPGHIAYFKIVRDNPPKHIPSAWVGGSTGPACRTAIKVFGDPPDRDGPMLCTTVVRGVSLWAPLGHGEDSSLWVPLTSSGDPSALRIPLHPEDWEVCALTKLRQSFVSLQSAFMFRARDLPDVTILDAFEGPRPRLGMKKTIEARTRAETKHGVVWLSSEELRARAARR